MIKVFLPYVFALSTALATGFVDLPDGVEDATQSGMTADVSGVAQINYKEAWVIRQRVSSSDLDGVVWRVKDSDGWQTILTFEIPYSTGGGDFEAIATDQTESGNIYVLSEDTGRVTEWTPPASSNGSPTLVRTFNHPSNIVPTESGGIGPEGLAVMKLATEIGPVWRIFIGHQNGNIYEVIWVYDPAHGPQLSTYYVHETSYDEVAGLEIVDGGKRLHVLHGNNENTVTVYSINDQYGSIDLESAESYDAPVSGNINFEGLGVYGDSSRFWAVDGSSDNPPGYSGPYLYWENVSSLKEKSKKQKR